MLRNCFVSASAGALDDGDCAQSRASAGEIHGRTPPPARSNDGRTGRRRQPTPFFGRSYGTSARSHWDSASRLRRSFSSRGARRTVTRRDWAIVGHCTAQFFVATGTCQTPIEKGLGRLPTAPYLAGGGGRLDLQAAQHAPASGTFDGRPASPSASKGDASRGTQGCASGRKRKARSRSRLSSPQSPIDSWQWMFISPPRLLASTILGL